MIIDRGDEVRVVEKFLQASLDFWVAQAASEGGTHLTDFQYRFA